MPGALLRSNVARLVVAALAGVLLSRDVASQATPPAPVYPGAQWERLANPASVQTSAARLEVLRAWLKTGNTKAMVVTMGGRTLFEYGDVTTPSKVASVRKSILATMFGKYVASGVVDLDKTVVELGLEDLQPFLDVEKSATLRHLLLARSGIYLPAGHEELAAASPRRGSQQPGTYYQYQNWDFNAAGAAFEKLTGQDIYDAFERDLARPLAMQDFSRSDQKKVYTPTDSKFPEYPMHLSARDMARIGLLMLRNGQWRGQQVVPADWVRQITTLVTPPASINPAWLGAPTWARRWGYGMLWWVWDAPNVPGAVTGFYQGAFTAMGAFGQYITVLPVGDMVIVHTVEFESFERDKKPVPEVLPWEYDAILQMVIAS